MLAGQKFVITLEFGGHGQRNAHRVTGLGLDAFDHKRMKLFHINAALRDSDPNSL